MKRGIATEQRLRCPCCAAANHDRPHWTVHPKMRGKTRCPRCGTALRISEVKVRNDA